MILCLLSAEILIKKIPTLRTWCASRFEPNKMRPSQKRFFYHVYQPCNPRWDLFHFMCPSVHTHPSTGTRPGFFFVRTSRYLCFKNFWKTEFLPFWNWVFWKFEGFWAKNVWNCLFWAIFGENFHKSTVLELSFLAKTEFLKIFGIWVLEKSELSFSVLYKKSL